MSTAGITEEGVDTAPQERELVEIWQARIQYKLSECWNRKQIINVLLGMVWGLRREVYPGDF